jgi:hypothetical protein
LDIDGRLDAPVAGVRVPHVFHRIGEDDAEGAERVERPQRRTNPFTTPFPGMAWLAGPLTSPGNDF